MNKLTLLRTTYNTISKRIGSSLARNGVGITEGQYRYLGAIYEQPLACHQIGKVSGIPVQSVSRMHRALINGGFIERKAQAKNADHRESFFKITAKGKKAFDKAAPLVEAALTLSREDFLGLAKELRK